MANCNVGNSVVLQSSRAAKGLAVLANGTRLFGVGQSLCLIACLSACALAQSLPARQEAIHFSSDGFTLAGTLYLPAGAGPYAAVVLFHGSGAQPRYEFEGPWFAAHGVAALTYDKRGVGESTGDFRSIPFMTLCDDGLAGIQLLKARGDIDPKRIGVWGLSQGGWLGPLAASRSSDVAFVIAVSGPGVSPGEQMIYFWENDLRDRGVPERQVKEATALRREVWQYMETSVATNAQRPTWNAPAVLRGTSKSSNSVTICSKRSRRPKSCTPPFTAGFSKRRSMTQSSRCESSAYRACFCSAQTITRFLSRRACASFAKH